MIMGSKGFKTIVITSPERIVDEAEKIARLLDGGVYRVHIRKPEYTLREVKDLIEAIPYRLRRRLTLHGHFALFDEMNLAGAHLNSRNSEAPRNADSLSRSCHNLSEIAAIKPGKYEYVTLSPIFDSISKAGYRSAFDLEQLDLPDNVGVVALGGVTPDILAFLKEKGFFGAALLGYIWEGDFEKRSDELITAIESLTRGSN